jgi:predicted mannosyl-3-phosphoglycerate phosphatase (HAD superfamily)
MSLGYNELVRLSDEELQNLKSQLDMVISDRDSLYQAANDDTSEEEEIEAKIESIPRAVWDELRDLSDATYEEVEVERKVEVNCTFYISGNGADGPYIDADSSSFDMSQEEMIATYPEIAQAVGKMTAANERLEQRVKEIAQLYGLEEEHIWDSMN